MCDREDADKQDGAMLACGVMLLPVHLLVLLAFVAVAGVAQFFECVIAELPGIVDAPVDLLASVIQSSCFCGCVCRGCLLLGAAMFRPCSWSSWYCS